MLERVAFVSIRGGGGPAHYLYMSVAKHRARLPLALRLALIDYASVDPGSALQAQASLCSMCLIHRVHLLLSPPSFMLVMMSMEA
jgi:hypothetical protein